MDRQTLSMVSELCDKTVPPLNGIRAVLYMTDALPDTPRRDAMFWALEHALEQLEEVQELHNKMHQIGFEENRSLTIVE